MPRAVAFSGALKRQQLKEKRARQQQKREEQQQREEQQRNEYLQGKRSLFVTQGYRDSALHYKRSFSLV
jgi:ribosomal protein L12E/L44/L45/RPP1/RPP2